MPSKNYPRPSSVRLAGYLILAFALGEIFLCWSDFAHRTPELAGLYRRAYYVTEPLVAILCGIYVLRGASWSRVVFLAVVTPLPIFFAMCLGSSTLMTWFGLAPVLLCLPLMSREANRFFVRRDTFFPERSMEEKRQERRSKYQY